MKTETDLFLLDISTWFYACIDIEEMFCIHYLQFWNIYIYSKEWMDIFWSDILTYLLRAASAGGRGAGMVQVAGYKYDLNGLSSPPSPEPPS